VSAQLPPCLAANPKPAGTLVEVLELFTFRDGVRLAWVTWIIGDGPRRAVSVREYAR
jgi:hypothetical protein